jgi:hypothetical protein
MVADDPSSSLRRPEDPVYTPGYYAVFFNDPITGIHFELAHTPLLPSVSAFRSWLDALKAEWKDHPEWKQPPWKEAMRRLPPRSDRRANDDLGTDS